VHYQSKITYTKSNDTIISKPVRHEIKSIQNETHIQNHQLLNNHVISSTTQTSNTNSNSNTLSKNTHLKFNRLPSEQVQGSQN